jgi:outer membrane lipoprotein-sorting protein
MRKPLSVTLFCLAAQLALSPLLSPSLAAQSPDILTADQFFAQVSERYAQITDYEGRLSITTGKTTMLGTVAFKTPSLLRIDFIQPPDQVIAFNGQVLTVYIPEYRAVLSQSAGEKSPTGAVSASLASREGLKMMKRSYTVAFELSPTPVPIDETSTEQVIRLVLNRRTVAEGFRTIKLSINPESKLIRRIEGWTLANEKLVFDFSLIKTNQNIPEARFVYDSPASANVYNNFLFKSEN